MGMAAYKATVNTEFANTEPPLLKETGMRTCVPEILKTAHPGRFYTLHFSEESMGFRSAN